MDIIVWGTIWVISKLSRKLDRFFYCRPETPTLKPLWAKIPQSAKYPPVTPHPWAFVDYYILLFEVAPIKVQILVFQTKEGLILTLPVLKIAILIALKKKHLYQVFNFRGSKTQLEGKT